MVMITGGNNSSSSDVGYYKLGIFLVDFRLHPTFFFYQCLLLFFFFSKLLGGEWLVGYGGDKR